MHIFREDSSSSKQPISPRRKFTSQISFIGLKNEQADEHTGDQYIYWICCGCAFIFFTKWWWTPYVLVIQLIFFFSKKLCKLTRIPLSLSQMNKLLTSFPIFVDGFVGIHTYITETLAYYSNSIGSVVNHDRRSVIFPPPLIGVHRVGTDNTKKSSKYCKLSGFK